MKLRMSEKTLEVRKLHRERSDLKMSEQEEDDSQSRGDFGLI